MKAQRRSEFYVALVSCLFFASMTLVSQASYAQQKNDSTTNSPSPAPASSPTPADAVVKSALSASPSPTPADAVVKSAPSASPTPSPRAVSTSPPSSGMIGDDGHLIVNSDLITLTVTVMDPYGRYVTGLSKKAFAVTDEKAPQEITFFSDEDAPISLGIIFDVSGSMGGDKIGRAREALRHFVDTSHDGDEYFLIGFNQRAQLLLDKTRDSNALLDKLTFVQTHGQTALYDACYLGVEKVQHGIHPKRAILLISDGQDNSSRYTFSELRRMLKETDVLIYAVGIEGANDGELGVEGEAILTELASVSGGKAFFPNTAADMNDIFERIALELRHQYSISYRPSNFTADGKWHHIKVKVTPPRGLPRLSVRNKDGYYAVTNPR